MTLALAMALDAVFGEPDWLWRRLPHPAVLIGRCIGWADTRFNTGARRKAKGACLAAALLVGAITIGSAIAALGWPVEAIAAAILLAHRSLLDHVAAVATGLGDSLDRGRKAVAMIVGRDTRDLDEPGVARAAIESAAENFSDGVIAPIFWFLVAGLPGMLAYKAINTADSMVGYLTPKHQEFGWASAKLDDVLNWIPARATAALILIVHGRVQQWHAVVGEAPRHRSPNAGWPESALARSMGIALSGPRAYHGELRDFPFVNPDGRKDLGPTDIDAANTFLWRSWAATFALVLLTALAIG